MAQPHHGGKRRPTISTGIAISHAQTADRNYKYPVFAPVGMHFCFKFGIITMFHSVLFRRFAQLLLPTLKQLTPCCFQGKTVSLK
ncbi:MAG: hypothetical protein QM237_04565 [Bacteroidota bacterium]|nr:hypothetical protein [Bacteroidota bacterium]